MINKLESCKEANEDFLQAIDDIVQSIDITWCSGVYCKLTGNPVNKQEFYQTTKSLYVHCIDLLNTANLTKQVTQPVSIQCLVILLSSVVC